MEKNKSLISQVEGKTEDIIDYARDFFKMEASGGIVLVFAAIAAMIVANSGLSSFYTYVLDTIHFQIGFFSEGPDFYATIDKPIVLWINDGLMAVFFFLVGLEIKRELLDGELASAERIILPMLGAIGGMIVPVAIYYLINKDNPVALDGWAIPAATDIAFALGVLALVGSRAPTSLKVLLTAIAIIDDLGAILIIAFFYTENLYLTPFIVVAACILALFLLKQRKVCNLTPYILLGIVMWAAVLQSGVHATLAGVVTALFIPIKSTSNPEFSPLRHLEHSLHPWVAFMVLPIFAFANAGVPLGGLGVDNLTDGTTLGIALGLFAGKQLGIFFFLWLAIILGLSPKPAGANWWQLYGVSALCGIGFTMSLFIGGLAFDSQENAAAVRLGVLMGSVASALLAYGILRFGPTNQYQPLSDNEKEEYEGTV